MKAPEHTKPHYTKTIQNIIDFDIQYGKEWTKRWVAHARGAGKAVDGYVACTWHTLCRKALQHYEALVG